VVEGPLHTNTPSVPEGTVADFLSVRHCQAPWHRLARSSLQNWVYIPRRFMPSTDDFVFSQVEIVWVKEVCPPFNFQFLFGNIGARKANPEHVAKYYVYKPFQQKLGPVDAPLVVDVADRQSSIFAPSSQFWRLRITRGREEFHISKHLRFRLSRTYL